MSAIFFECIEARILQNTRIKNIAKHKNQEYCKTQ